MSKRLYVGNLSFSTTEDGLRQFFGSYGEVVSVSIITDRDTGKARGFGFVEMGSEEAAGAAITALNGSQLDGRELKVNEALERPNRGGRPRD